MSGAGLTFLFWNLKRARPDILARLAKSHAVDVLMLAECPLKPADILVALNQDRTDFFFVPSRSQIAIFTRFPDQYLQCLEPPVDNDHYVIRRMAIPGRLVILLCVVHFPSKLRLDPLDQSAYAADFGRTVLAPAEKREKHARTILAGDLNMNAYEDGVVQYNGLHGVMTREIAQKEWRTVGNFESNRFFYNPMWRHFGEQATGHAGTYYYSKPKARADYWNIYDQVLVRPDLLPYFSDADLRILHDVDLEFSLLQKGIPNQKEVSDHLPILFRLNI